MLNKNTNLIIARLKNPSIPIVAQSRPRPASMTTGYEVSQLLNPRLTSKLWALFITSRGIRRLTSMVKPGRKTLVTLLKPVRYNETTFSLFVIKLHENNNFQPTASPLRWKIDPSNWVSMESLFRRLSKCVQSDWLSYNRRPMNASKIMSVS